LDLDQTWSLDSPVEGEKPYLYRRAYFVMHTFLVGKCESFSLLPTRTKLKKVNDKTIDFIYLSHNIRITCIKFVCLMVFNVTFNNILVISWQSILLETGGTGEITTDLSQVTDKLYHLMMDTSPWSRFELTTSMVIGTNCIGSCKSNYHTITAMTAPQELKKVNDKTSDFI